MKIKAEILNRCLSGNIYEERFTGSKIKNYIENPFLTYCYKFVSKEHRDHESLYLKLLAEKGLEHELNIIVNLKGVIRNQTFDSVEAFKHSIGFMKKGYKNLAGFPLFYLKDSYEGHIDLMKRNDNQSSLFGEYFYEVVEIKLAKNIKKKHIFQAAYYNDLLGKVQGYTPENFFLINREGKEIPYKFEMYKEELHNIMKDIRQIWNKEILPEALYDHKNSNYPWSSYTNQKAIEKRDITLIPGIGSKTRSELLKLNLKNINDVCTAPIELLTKAKGIGQKKAILFKALSEALNTNSIVSLNNKETKPTLPSANIELYIDFEGIDPITNPISMEAVDFLYGVIKKEKSTKKYIPFFIYDISNEDEVKTVFKSFLDYLNAFPDSPIFHWHHYEPSRIKRTFLSAEIESDCQNLISRFYDLSKYVNKNWAFPVYSLSLKELARYFGFHWQIDDFDGSGAIATYVEYMNSFIKDENLIEKLYIYNKDDIEAMIVLKEWMKGN